MIILVSQKIGILYLVDPNNPHGTVISEQEALKMVEVMHGIRERDNLD